MRPGLSGCAIDLVRQHDVRKDRPLVDAEIAALRIEHRCAHDVRRQQVRRELDATELRVDRFGKTPNHECLRKTRQPLEQDVPARKQRDQQPFDRCVLPHDALMNCRRDTS